MGMLGRENAKEKEGREKPKVVLCRATPALSIFINIKPVAAVHGCGSIGPVAVVYGCGSTPAVAVVSHTPL